MGTHAAKKTLPLPKFRRRPRREKHRSWKRWAAWIAITIVALFTAMCVLGALVPAKTPAHAATAPGPPGIMTVLHGHVEAVVQSTTEGRNVTLVNTGTQPASAVFTWTQLCVEGPTVTAYNLQTQTYSTPIGGIKTTIPAGQARVYVLVKE
jgi:hypothetical protein